MIQMISVFMLTAMISVASLGSIHAVHAAETAARDTLPPRSELRAFSVSQLREARDQNLELRSSGFSPEPELLDGVLRGVRSWRTGDVLSPGARNLSIGDAPYPDALLAARLPTLWQGLWEENYAAEKARLVENTPLEMILDGLLEGYIGETLPPELSNQARAIGKCLAKRAVSGRSQACVLDPSETVRKVSSVKLAWLKLECGMLNFTSPCGVRQQLYDALKPQLIEARKNNPTLKAMIEAEFEKQFPVRFRESFLEEVNSKRGSIAKLISSKFGAMQREALWGRDALLVEPEERGSQVVTLRGFARSLESEVLAASFLQADSNPVRKGAAAPLFYSAANRLLALTGGSKAVWDSNSRSFALDSASPFDPTQPTRAPVLAQTPFGGWGVGLVEGAPRFLAWDWAGYDPLTEEGIEGRIRLFVESWRLSPQGNANFAKNPEELRQNLGDLADLLSALNVFLAETRPDTGAFARFFGPESQAADMLEPGKPLIFPLEGRTLAIGVLAGALKNMIAPRFGHLVLKQQGDPDFGLGIEFVEQVDLLQGRRADLPTSTSAVARILIAAGELRDTLRTDPDVPAELQALLPRLDEIQQIGAIYLGAQAQMGDGGFTRFLGTSSGGDRVAADTVLGMQALTGAWNKSELLLLLVRIHQGWLHLENRWAEIEALVVAGAPIRELRERGVSPSELWQWLRLWRMTQAKVRPRLDQGMSPPISWGQWEVRMQALEKNLRTVWDPSQLLVL